MVKRISRSPPRGKPTPAATASLKLDETLDLNAAGRLRSALLAQVLASAASTWAADGAVFTIASPSEPFGQGARLLGLHSLLFPESNFA